MRTWCWRDVFVYRECCDTASYGPGGLELCFAQPGLSFDICCPPPEDLEAPIYGAPRRWVSGWFEGEEHLGCRSRFHWLPAAIAFTLNFGTEYHPRTGDVLDRAPGLNTTMSKNSVQRALKQHLEENADLGFGSFLRLARRYYEAREANIELTHMINEILTRFGDSLTECPQAAFLAAFLKIESIFSRDLATARRFAHSMRTLLMRTITRGRVPEAETWDAHFALENLEVLDRKPRLTRPATVDFVVPLCSLDDVGATAGSLRQVFGEVPEVTMPGAFQAEMALHIYDTCSLITHHFSDGSGKSLSALLFDGLPGRTAELFGAGGAGRGLRLFVSEFVEEVPAGDLTAYMHHIAEASASGTLADVTFLLHADFAEHIRTWTMEQILGSLASGAWPHDDVDFLYLGWRHEGPNQDGGRRVATTLRWHCSTNGPRLKHCFNHPPQPLARGVRFGDFNPVLFENVWRWTFGCDFDARTDDFGGFDFSQLLVSKRAAQARSAGFWRHLARAITDRSSFQLLPGTRFISRRVDLSPQYKFNKGVSIWFEHLWHLVFDPLFFPEKPDAGSLEPGGQRDLRAFTRMGDPRLPLGFRVGGMGVPDSVMLRHYWLSADEQCKLFKDRQGCHLAKLSSVGAKPESHSFLSDPLWSAGGQG
mmetsp:Transcript_63248/g.206384  ORF Transcript_63248/g.206384 Transcript_63248/m.206384 type:complete len:650 (+) Transcript_63248:178-2127(+)